MNMHVSDLLEKEVSRKEFLGMSGLAVASVFGFGSVIKLLTGKSLGGAAGGKNLASGFGSGAYGGFKERH
jgi:hypothetical protein